MDINNLATTSGNPTYYDKNFLLHMESHFTYLASRDGAKQYPVDPHTAYKYRGDFYGLLDTMRIPRQYHSIVMRLNHLSCPGDFKADMESVLIPDLKEIDLIQSVYSQKVVSM
jgi:hypothetical protein